MSNHSKHSISFHNTKFRIPFHGSATSANGNSKTTRRLKLSKSSTHRVRFETFRLSFSNFNTETISREQHVGTTNPNFPRGTYIPNSVLPEFLHGGSIHTCFPTESFGSFQLNSHVLIRFSKQRDFRGVLTLQINTTLTKNKWSVRPTVHNTLPAILTSASPCKGSTVTREFSSVQRRARHEVCLHSDFCRSILPTS